MRYILPVCVIAFAFSLLGELGTFWWVFDLLSHWRVLYMFAGLLLLALMIYARRSYLALAVLSILLAHAVRLTPYLFAAGSAEMGPPHTVTIEFANTYWHNHDILRIATAIRVDDPDVIFFFETLPQDFERLQTELKAEYPYGRMQPGTYAFNVGYLSKQPVLADETLYFTQFVPSLQVKIALPNEQTLTILGIHPYSPVLAEFTERRNRELTAVAEYLASYPDPIIVGGDFNVSQFSPVFTEFLELSGARDTQRQFGVQSSWPSHAPSFARIPIDQVVVSPTVHVFNRRIGTETGSDHLPVLVEVGL